MNENQAERIIELLESINNKLEEIQSDTSWINHHTGNIETNTSN